MPSRRSSARTGGVSFAPSPRTRSPSTLGANTSRSLEAMGLPADVEGEAVGTLGRHRHGGLHAGEAQGGLDAAGAVLGAGRDAGWVAAVVERPVLLALGLHRAVAEV